MEFVLCLFVSLSSKLSIEWLWDLPSANLDAEHAGSWKRLERRSGCLCIKAMKLPLPFHGWGPNHACQGLHGHEFYEIHEQDNCGFLWSARVSCEDTSQNIPY